MADTRADAQPQLVELKPELAFDLAQRAMRGSVFPALVVHEHMLVATLTGEQLEPMTYNPNVIEDPKALEHNPRLREIAPVRELVQRMFLKSKKDNALEYGRYIEQVELHGRFGFTPAIDLWTPDSIDYKEIGLGGLCFASVERDQFLVPFEGETQLAGRFQAWEREPQLKKMPIHVVIVHGRPAKWARQAFHDVNVFGVRPNAALAIAMDEYDLATLVARRLEQDVPFLRGTVNMKRRQLRKRDRANGELMTITALRSSVATLAKGIHGVAYGTRSVPIDETERERLHSNAVTWWTALGARLEKEIADGNSVASAPAAIAALGAVGHDVLENRGSANEAVSQLASEVKWTKGERWAGIAGKFTPKGNFSVGGAKETAYLIYKALADPSTEGYARIRS